MNERPTWNSVVVTVVLLAICAAIGMVALPLIFGPTPSELATLAWLVAAVLLSILVIVLTLQLSRPLAGELGRGVGSSSITPSQTMLLARLLLFGLALATTQAILRRPIALVLGGDSAVSIESGIAAAALAVVLVMLVWVYQTARPMVQAATLRAIDAAVPTTGVALAAEPTRTSVSVVSSGPVPAPTDAVTVVAPLFVMPRSTRTPTVLAGRTDDDATVLATENSDATVLTHRDTEATVVAKRPETEATIVAQGPDDPTLPVHGA